jgi:methanogenic corrinoid protein MtbC1
MNPERNYEIHEVAELTGLATARLRAWERRHAVVRPARLPNRYRVYSGEQVALLRAFARLCAAGERIGDLVLEPRESVIARAEGEVTDNSPLSHMMAAVKRMDRDRLTQLLAAERQGKNIEQFAQAIVRPLGEIIGDLWALGKLSIAAEHLASEVVVQLLKQELDGAVGVGALVVAACLPGERHEWGFLSHLAVLKSRGWRVRYLGCDLPLNEVVEAAWTLLPACLGLSAADPANVAARMAELRRLPRLLPPDMLLVIGGEGAEENGARLRRSGFRVGAAAFPDPPRGPAASQPSKAMTAR